jgi:hypothetical protein
VRRFVGGSRTDGKVGPLARVVFVPLLVSCGKTGVR